MTILTAVTDMITTTNLPFLCLASPHALCVRIIVIGSQVFSAHHSPRHDGDPGISSGEVPHGLGKSICDMSLVWCGVIRNDLRLAKPIPCDLIQASISSFPPPCPPLSL